MPATASKSDLLLDPSFMARLDQLDVMSRKLLAGKMKGERRSKRRGQSVEFADYRNYVVGDDLRFIDWNIYARLERLFLKLFLEEEDLALYILVDVSKSCDYGTPNKALYLKQVAAALGYIGLVNYNRVTIAAMADGIVAETGAMRGRRRRMRSSPATRDPMSPMPRSRRHARWRNIATGICRFGRIHRVYIRYARRWRMCSGCRRMLSPCATRTAPGVTVTTARTMSQWMLRCSRCRSRITVSAYSGGARRSLGSSRSGRRCTSRSAQRWTMRVDRGIGRRRSGRRRMCSDPPVAATC